MKKIIRCLILMISVVVLSGCFLERREPAEYIGEYPELFTVAINSLLGVRGYSLSGGHQPTITILEEDDYGRVLFEYREGGFSYPSRLIMQKAENGYAYFYPYYNFILRYLTSAFSYSYGIPNFSDEETISQWLELQEKFRELFDNETHDSLEERLAVQDSMDRLLSEIPDFTDEMMEGLKVANSWNQVMSDASELVRVRIVRQKEEGPISPEKLAEVHNTIFPDIPRMNITDTRNVSYRVVFLRTDNYGRSVYLGSWQDDHIVVLFQPNQLFNPRTGTLEIAELNNYQTELRLFLEANGWGTSR